jgi:PDZ domain-containing protein
VLGDRGWAGLHCQRAKRLTVHKKSFSSNHAALILGQTAITFDFSWLLVAPAATWALAALYVPVLGAFLTAAEVWGVAIFTVLLSVIALILHAAAHIIGARLYRDEAPPRLALHPLGDAAQAWPAGRSASAEAVGALAGPVASLLLAGLAYLVWNAQLHPYLNVSASFLMVFNSALAVINLAPAFPLDGGRLLRAIWWGLLLRPAAASRLGRRAGYLLALLLVGWALYLLAQQSYFSAQTSTTTLIVAGLIALGLWMQGGWEWDRPVPARPSRGAGAGLRQGAAGLLIALLLLLTVGLAPTNAGLEFPGIAPDVAPMIEVPPEYRHPISGRFILTTVVQQTPILAAQWLFGRISPIVEIVPPETIVPPGSSPQEVAEQAYNMLEESEATAAAVALQLAGYDATITGNGVRVVDILPDSPSRALLQPDDVIVGVNGTAVGTAAELIEQLSNREAGSTVQLQVERAADDAADDKVHTLRVEAPLMPPVEPGGPPRIGIRVETAGFSVELPFPVRIVPQKIVGGPSAGLMFTLAIYNLLTPEDLTGGRTIAGTGTISPDGTVGPIGGVAQKVVGAEVAGADYFLSPPENYAAAVAAARTIEVVQVATAAEAIAFLQSLPPQAAGN